MNKKDREQLNIFNKKIDYIVKETAKQSMFALIAISVAYFAIAASITFMASINSGQLILMLGSYVAGLIFLCLGLYEGYIWKKKYEDYLKKEML